MNESTAKYLFLTGLALAVIITLAKWLIDVF